MSKREFSVDPGSEQYPDGLGRVPTLDGYGYAVYTPPVTTMQALMEAAPGVAVRRSREEFFHLREILADAIDDLPPIERWVFERLIIERLPIRATADLLSTSRMTVQRLKETAIQHLREKLADNTQVMEFLYE